MFEEGAGMGVEEGYKGKRAGKHRQSVRRQAACADKCPRVAARD